jgi:hypothetical protein
MVNMTINALKCRDAVIFSPHPLSRNTALEITRVLRAALAKQGAPEDLVLCLPKPSIPLAQELMQSSIPARLAYVGPDGFPRAIPIGFHWNGAEFVLCTVPHAPKVSALKANPKVALTVDTNTFPPHVLLVRGIAAIDLVDGVPAEYEKGSIINIPYKTKMDIRNLSDEILEFFVVKAPNPKDMEK